MKIGKAIFQYIKSRLPLVLLLLCTVSGVVANAVYAKYTTDLNTSVNMNVVGEGEIKIAVSKNDDGTYSIHHMSDSKIPAYIRFTVVTNWKQKEGGALWYEGPDPEKVTVAASNAQPLSDGYYYCYYVVGEKKKAEIAINEVISGIKVTTTQSAPNDEYELDVQILAEAIQCMPANVVETAWGVTFNGTDWVKK